VSEEREVQQEKQYAPIRVIDSGTLIEEREEHPEKQYIPISDSD
jgi:hypothetical protein